jgi:DNA-binding NarL/FixJ family response regulator
MQSSEEPTSDVRCGLLPNVANRWQEPLSRSQSLTEREREIFLLLGEGLSNIHIARQLAVTERTVKLHVTSVLAKLGVESRLQAGIVACLHLIARAEDGDSTKVQFRSAG